MASMARPADNEYLCFGDAVFLADDDHGPAEAEGFGEDTNVGIAKVARDVAARVAFSNVAVFTVRHQLTLNAAAALKDYEDNTGEAAQRLTARSGSAAKLQEMEHDAKAEGGMRGLRHPCTLAQHHVADMSNLYWT